MEKVGDPILSLKFLVIATLVLNSVLASLLMSAAFIRAREGSRTKAFAALCATGLVYSLGYILELVSPDLRATLQAIKIEYIAIALMPSLLLLVVQDFAEKKLKSKTLLALFFVPAVTLALVFTMEHHALYYIAPSITHEKGLTLLTFGRGPGYWMFNAYKFTVIAYTVFVFGRFSFRGPRYKRIQARYMLIGSLLPWVGNFFYIARVVPFGLDPTPLVFAATIAFYSMGFFRYRVFDICPVARERVFDQMRDAVLVSDSKGRIIDHNRAAKSLFPDVVTPLGITTLNDIEALAPILPDINKRSANGKTTSLSMPKIGKRFDLRRSILRDSFDKPLGSALVFMDVTERARMEERLSILASTDELTGVANRRKFFERAQTEWDRARRYGRPFGVAILDIDDFKSINDRYGHPAGDEALRVAAKLCAETLRAADVMGRYGGDEFAFAFPECGEEKTKEAAARLVGIIASAVLPYNSERISLSASVGAVGISAPPLPDLESLLRIADERMYEQKALRRPK